MSNVAIRHLMNTKGFLQLIFISVQGHIEPFKGDKDVQMDFVVSFAPKNNPQF